MALMQSALVLFSWEMTSALAGEMTKRRKLTFTYWMHAQYYVGGGKGLIKLSAMDIISLILIKFMSPKEICDQSPFIVYMPTWHYISLVCLF